MISRDDKRRSLESFQKLTCFKELLFPCSLSQVSGKYDKIRIQISYEGFKSMKDVSIYSPKVKVGKMDESEITRRHKKVLLYMSPKSRSGGKNLEFVTKLLADRGHIILNDIEADCPSPSEDILKFPEAEVVIVGGGDGSVNMALNGLIQSKLPLLVIPLGTANNLARSYEIPNDIEACIDLLDDGVITKIDVGLVNDLPFVNVAGLGLSTEINRRTPSRLKRFLGVFAFILTGLRILRHVNPFRSSITADGKTIKSKSWQISICNGKHYGAGMVIKHDASHEDQALHLLSTEVDRWWKAFTLFPAFMSGRYKKDQEVTLLEANEIEIKTRRPLKVDVDGDIRTETPAKFKVLPGSLELVVPPQETGASTLSPHKCQHTFPTPATNLISRSRASIYPISHSPPPLI